MHSEAIICPATPADLEAIAGIFAHYVTSSLITFEEIPPTVAEWQQRLNDLAVHGLPFLVARIGDKIVGYAYAGLWRSKPAYRHTVEDSVYLAPGCTGRGLGRALLEALLCECEKVGTRQVIAVIADTGSEASTALHRRVGFTDVGRLTGVGRKHGRWVDTILMQRALPTAGA